MKPFVAAVLALGTLGLSATLPAGACEGDKSDHAACDSKGHNCKCKNCGCDHDGAKGCSQEKPATPKK